MAPEVATSVTSAQPRRAPERDWPPSRLQRRGPWLVLVGLAVVIIGGWFVLIWKPAIAHYQTDTRGPVALDGDLESVQVGVQYPRFLYMDDQGVEAGKKIVVSLVQTRTLPAEAIELAVISRTDAVRLLNRDGIEIGGRSVVTATCGIPALATIYVEHTNNSSVGHWGSSTAFAVYVTSTGVAMTQLDPIDELGFSLEAEGPWNKFLRDDLIKLLGGILVLIAAPVVPWWWERWQDIRKLGPQVRRQIEDRRMDLVRDSYTTYEGHKMPWLFLQDFDLEARYRRAEARLWHERALQTLEEPRVALGHLQQARRWYPYDEDINILHALLDGLLSSSLVERLKDIGDGAVPHLLLLLDSLTEGYFLDVRGALLSL